MPYSNLPRNLWGKMDRCVESVQSRSGVGKQRAIQICYTSITGGKSLDELLEKEIEMNAKQRRKERRKKERKLDVALAKKEAGEELTLEDLRVIAESEPLDEAVSQDQAAAEIAAAINPESDDVSTETWTDPGDVMTFERKVVPEKEEKDHYGPEEAKDPMLPAGGATTFDELDDYREAMKEAQGVRTVIGDFEMLVENVLAKSSPGELGDKIVALGSEMKNRLEDPVAEKAAEPVSDADPNLLDRIKGLFTKAEISTASINDLPDSAFAYIEPGGKKDESGKTSPRSLRHYPIHDAAHVRNALARASQQINRGGKSAAIARKALPKIRAAAKKMKIGQPGKKESGIRIEKAKDGSYRWFGWVSNKFRDRDLLEHPEGQIIAEKAHQEFVEWVWQKPKERMPQLWIWHTPYTAHKSNWDWIDYADGFLLGSGPLTGAEAERFKALETQYDLAMSHGMLVDSSLYDKDNGVIHRYRTFEGSYLPREHVANEWTDIQTIAKEAAEMGFSETKRKFLVDALGEDKVKELESETEGRSKALEDLGVEFKDLADTLERMSDADEPEAEAEIDGGKLNSFLESLTEQVGEQGKAIKALSEAVVKLAKDDDEKIAEQLKPRVDVKERTIPVWERALSNSKETVLKEEEDEKDKALGDQKPGTELHWLEEVLGEPSAEAAGVPR